MNLLRFIILCPVFALAADELPPNVVIVPVAHAQCLALNPNKPVLYVGLPSGGERGLASFALDEKGVPIADSRKDFADGIVEDLPVAKGSEYAIGMIAVNPVLPQIYLGARPWKFAAFRANAEAADVVAVDLDEDGFPDEKSSSLRSGWRLSPVQHLACDALGRYVYLGELHGSMGLWSTADEAPDPTPKTVSSARKHPSKRQPQKKKAAKNPLGLPVLITDWTYVPEWRRCYGNTKDSVKVIFAFSDDGASCVFAQPLAIRNRFELTPVVSVKHRKMYVGNTQEAKLGVYELTAEGHLTSLPRSVAFEATHGICVDDKNDQLYVITPKGALAIYSLDAAGMPTGEPRRFQLKSGTVNAAILSPTTGVLYLACSAPAKGKS